MVMTKLVATWRSLNGYSGVWGGAVHEGALLAAANEQSKKKVVQVNFTLSRTPPNQPPRRAGLVESDLQIMVLIFLGYHVPILQAETRPRPARTVWVGHRYRICCLLYKGNPRSEAEPG